MNTTLERTMAPEKELPAVSRRLRELRTAAGLTQEGLAKAAEISLAAVQHIERGMYPDIKVATALALAKGLGVPVAELIDPQPAAPPKPKRTRKPKGGEGAQE